MRGLIFVAFIVASSILVWSGMAVFNPPSANSKMGESFIQVVVYSIPLQHDTVSNVEGWRRDDGTYVLKIDIDQEYSDRFNEIIQNVERPGATIVLNGDVVQNNSRIAFLPGEKLDLSDGLIIGPLTEAQLEGAYETLGRDSSQ